MNEENDKYRAELKLLFSEYFKIFAGRFWIKVLYATGLSFYVGGYVFNNLQNSSELFGLAWFIDAMLLSWTNLLILPLLLTVVPWSKANRNWELFKDNAKYHFYSPFIWIVGYLFLKLCVKMLDSVGAILTFILRYLAS